ncbi:MAG: sigma-70 family RNA polymerase sigma factor [Bacteroidales bacterium]
MDEKDLIERVRNGEESAVRILVDRFQPRILRTARGFVRNEEDARDLTQEVLIDIIRNIHHFRFQAGLSTWIYRITVNRSLNHLRSSKKRAQTFSIDLPEEKGPGYSTLNLPDTGQSDPAQQMEQSDRSRILHAAIGSIPEKQRTAFVLSEYDDLSYKEIAEVMNVSLSSVESLLFRARKNLQKKLWHCYKKNG